MNKSPLFTEQADTNGAVSGPGRRLKIVYSDLGFRV